VGDCPTAPLVRLRARDSEGRGWRVVAQERAGSAARDGDRGRGMACSFWRARIGCAPLPWRGVQRAVQTHPAIGMPCAGRRERSHATDRLRARRSLVYCSPPPSPCRAARRGLLRVLVRACVGEGVLCARTCTTLARVCMMMIRRAYADGIVQSSLLCAPCTRCRGAHRER